MAKKPAEIVIKLVENDFNLSQFQDDSPEYKVKEKFLEQAIFEIRHAPLLEMVENKSKILKAFQSILPNTRFPQFANQLEDGVQLRSPDGKRIFWPRCQLLSVEETDYASFKNFKSTCLKYCQLYQSLFPLPTTLRTSLRYINKIPVAALPEEPQKALSIDLKFGGKAPEFVELLVKHIVPPGVFVRTALSGTINQEGKQFVVWDNDISIESELSFETALMTIDLLHSVATKMFFAMLSEKMKERFLVQ